MGERRVGSLNNSSSIVRKREKGELDLEFKETKRRGERAGAPSNDARIWGPDWLVVHYQKGEDLETGCKDGLLVAHLKKGEGRGKKGKKVRIAQRERVIHSLSMGA